MGWFWNKEEKSEAELYMEQRYKQQKKSDEFDYSRYEFMEERAQPLYEDVQEDKVRGQKSKNKKPIFSIIKVIVIVYLLIQVAFPLVFIGVTSAINLAVNTTVFEKQEEWQFEKQELPEILTIADRDFYLIEDTYLDKFQGAIDGYWHNGANICIQAENTVYIPYEKYEEKTRWYKFDISENGHVLAVNDGFGRISVLTAKVDGKVKFWLFNSEYNGNFMKNPMVINTNFSEDAYQAMTIEGDYLMIFFEEDGKMQAIVYDYMEQGMIGRFDVRAVDYQEREISISKIVESEYNINLMDVNHSFLSVINIELLDDVVEIEVQQERKLDNIEKVIGYMGTNLLVKHQDDDKIMAYDWEYENDQLICIENEIAIPDGYKADDIVRCNGNIERLIMEMSDGTYFHKDVELYGDTLVELSLEELVEDAQVKEIFVDGPYDVQILTVDGGLYQG